MYVYIKGRIILYRKLIKTVLPTVQAAATGEETISGGTTTYLSA